MWRSGVGHNVKRTCVYWNMWMSLGISTLCGERTRKIFQYFTEKRTRAKRPWERDFNTLPLYGESKNKPQRDEERQWQRRMRTFRRRETWMQFFMISSIQVLDKMLFLLRWRWQDKFHRLFPRNAASIWWQGQAPSLSVDSMAAAAHGTLVSCAPRLAAPSELESTLK